MSIRLKYVEVIRPAAYYTAKKQAHTSQLDSLLLSGS